MNYIVLIPWILFFPLYIINIYSDLRKKKNTHLIVELKNNFFGVFRLDILFLIFVFIYFMQYNNSAVNKLLFISIHLYLFINSIYDLPRKEEYRKIEKLLYLEILVVILIPLLFYFFGSNLDMTYILMIILTFLSYILAVSFKSWNRYWLNRHK